MMVMKLQEYQENLSEHLQRMFNSGIPKRSWRQYRPVGNRNVRQPIKDYNNDYDSVLG
jgi:hypothetical protein